MKDGGLRLFVIGYESGNAEILKNIKKGVALEKLPPLHPGLSQVGYSDSWHFHSWPAGRDASETIQQTMRFAKEMNPETIQVSLASPYPGTAFYDYAIEHGYIKPEDMVDETGYQRCVINYPDLSGDEIYTAVEKFYKSYYLTTTLYFQIAQKDGAPCGRA